MGLRIGIIEDVVEEAKLLQDYIFSYCKEEGAQVEVDAFHSSAQFLEGFVAQYDILFIDIELQKNEENGMELAKHIREKDKDCTFIFVTNLGKYAVESYEVNAVDYIMKPINYESFKFRFSRVFRQYVEKERRTLSIKSRGSYYKIAVEDIYYVCIVNHSCYFYGRFEGQKENDPLTCYEAWTQLTSVEKAINSKRFVRCSPSYLVNIDHISKILKDSVVVGDTSLPLSRNRKKSVITLYLASFGGD